MNFLKDFLVVLVAAICFFALVSFLFYIGLSKHCEAYGKMTDLPTQMIGPECYIKSNNRWYTIRTYETFQVYQSVR